MNGLFGSVSGVELFFVGVVSALMTAIGFAVYISRRSSATNKLFFLLCLAAVAWSLCNFMVYQSNDADVVLWMLRSLLFAATWFAVAMFFFYAAFPDETLSLSRTKQALILSGAAAISLLTLSPFVFTRVLSIDASGRVSTVENGLGLPLFGMFVIPLVVAGFVTLFRKTYRTERARREPFLIVLYGTIVTFSLILVCNFILPAFFAFSDLVPYGSIYILPFILSTAYAVLRYKILDVKIMLTAILCAVLSILALVDVLLSTELFALLIRVITFALVLGVGILLIRSVFREVEQRELIERLSEEKSEFMTFASHEIRNPITAMRGLASLIVDGTTGVVSADTKDVAQKILIAGHDVLNIISTYLSKSKMELGQISYDKAVFDLGEAAANMAEGYAPHAEIKGLKLQIDIDRSHKYNLSGDQGKVKEVLGNLIDNALKYTKEGTIRVAVERHGPFVRAVISDSGVGIPEETLKELFKKFSRADAQKVNLLGTGIGLFLAKTFIEAQGGRIWAESNGQGKGSRFIIEFPAAQP